jgi:hypothetical protein
MSGDEATPSRFRCAVMEERHADTNEGQEKPSILSPSPDGMFLLTPDQHRTVAKDLRRGK